MEKENTIKSEKIDVDYGTPEAQERLAKEYLEAHKNYTVLMEEWQEQLRLKDKFDAENGHMPGAENAMSEYTEKMRGISDEMEKAQKIMKGIRPKFMSATIEKFLK